MEAVRGWVWIFSGIAYWPDKELRPVANSISFGNDNIGSNLQWNRKKIGAQLIGIGVTQCRYLDAFPNRFNIFLQNVKWMQFLNV